jgi:heme oxygenase (biliverdin-IX-beta and delta-forming)
MGEGTTYNKSEFIKALRMKTMPAHKQLESVPLSAAIVSPDVTHDQYAQYLEQMYAVNADAEQNIYPLLKNVVGDVNDRNKAHLIENDLQALGRNNSLPADKPFTSKKAEMTEAFALGIMYVIEGSTLGGRVILKNIQPALQLNEDNGASYFAGYGANTGPAWESFMNVLTNYPDSGATEQEVIAGADFAFSAIYEYMNR